MKNKLILVVVCLMVFVSSGMDFYDFIESAYAGDWKSKILNFIPFSVLAGGLLLQLYTVSSVRRLIGILGAVFSILIAMLFLFYFFPGNLERHNWTKALAAVGVAAMFGYICMEAIVNPVFGSNANNEHLKAFADSVKAAFQQPEELIKVGFAKKADLTGLVISFSLACVVILVFWSLRTQTVTNFEAPFYVVSVCPDQKPVSICRTYKNEYYVRCNYPGSAAEFNKVLNVNGTWGFEKALPQDSKFECQ